MECNDKVAKATCSNTISLSAAAEGKKLDGGNGEIVQNVLLHPSFTRKSCHRCGNIRKNCRKCQNCPHIICRNCVLKLSVMFNKDVFTPHSCPVCARLCCCSNKSNQCENKYHCYRKCPVSRLNRKKQEQKSTPKYCFTAGMLTHDAMAQFAEISGAASIAADPDFDHVHARCCLPRDEMEECQDEPETEGEECSGSPTPLLPSLSKSLSLMKESSAAFTITRRDNSMHDLKLPGFLSSGLLLGGEMYNARSCVYPAPLFEEGVAGMPSSDKTSSSPNSYSV